MGEDSFRRYDTARDRFVGSFLVTPFEVVALGIGYNYESWVDETITEIPEKVKAIWIDSKIINNSGSGIRANTRIPRVVPIGRNLFRR